MADFFAQMLFELPAAGVTWLLRRFTRLSQQTAELIAHFTIAGFIAAACFVAWFMYFAA